MKPTGKWVAAPMNIHRINWIWGNKAAMEGVGVTELPKTWADFNAACDKAVAARQDLPRAPRPPTGPTRPPSKSSSTARTSTSSRRPSSRATSMRCAREGMVKAFDQMRLMVTKYMDPGDRRPRLRHHLQHDGQRRRAVLHHGRLELGLLTAGGFKDGRPTILCAQAPTDWGKPGFILNSDSVVFFKQNDPDYIEGQKLLAAT